METVFQALLYKIYVGCKPLGIERSFGTAYFPHSDHNNSMTGDLRKEFRVRFSRNDTWKKIKESIEKCRSLWTSHDIAVFCQTEYLQIRWWNKRLESSLLRLGRKRRCWCQGRDSTLDGKRCDWLDTPPGQRDLSTDPTPLMLGKYSSQTLRWQAQERGSSVLSPWLHVNQSDCRPIALAIYITVSFFGVWKECTLAK